MCITGVVVVMTLEEAVVEGDSEWEGDPRPGDVGTAAGAVRVVA